MLKHNNFHFLIFMNKYKCSQVLLVLLLDLLLCEPTVVTLVLFITLFCRNMDKLWLSLSFVTVSNILPEEPCLVFLESFKCGMVRCGVLFKQIFKLFAQTAYRCD